MIRVICEVGTGFLLEQREGERQTLFSFGLNGSKADRKRWIEGELWGERGRWRGELWGPRGILLVSKVTIQAHIKVSGWRRTPITYHQFRWGRNRVFLSLNQVWCGNYWGGGKLQQSTWKMEGTVILKGRDKDVSEKKFLILDEKYDMVRAWAHNKRGRETAEKAMEMSVEKRRREGNR